MIKLNNIKNQCTNYMDLIIKTQIVKKNEELINIIINKKLILNGNALNLI